MSKFQYRPEIDGLRAVAVLAVALYHAFPRMLKGGYVGVDVFFVISGFLITSLIHKEITQGTFSYSRFYERRIRRLIPPLIPVIVVAWVLSFLLFSDSQFRDFSLSAYASLSFIANWHFLASISYFAAPDASTPLLHLWSLSVEEQFYFVFPILLIGIAKVKRSWLLPSTLVLLALSAIYAQYLVSAGAKDTAFFNSLARFWELLVGCALALSGKTLQNKRLCTFFEIVGLLLILAAVSEYRKSTPFPGVAAMPPVLGAALIIAAGGQGRIVAPLLKSRFMVFVGLISYPLYLWHWPILAFLHYAHPAATKPQLFLAVCLSVALAALSYRFIETPIRQRRILPTSRAAYGLVIAFTLSVSVLVAVSASRPIDPMRDLVVSASRELVLSENAQLLYRVEEAREFYMANLNINSVGDVQDQSFNNKARTCSFDNGNTADRVLDCLKAQAKESNVLVMGDSVGRDTWHALRRAYPETNFLMAHQSSCPPSGMPKVSSKALICFPDMAGFLEKAKERFPISAIVMSFNYDAANWRTVESGLLHAKSITDHVILFGVAPTFKQPMPELIKMIPKGGKPPAYIDEPDPVIVIEARKLAQENGVKFLDVAAFFCPDHQCALWAENSKNSLFFDHVHLTDIGISRYADFLKNQPVMAVLASYGDKAIN